MITTEIVKGEFIKYLEDFKKIASKKIGEK